VSAASVAIHGDYYASLPGTYVKRVNPVLWNSPDMQGAMGYHLDTYYHGPVQYLTLYPLAYLDSYEAIARTLQPLYLVVLMAGFLCVWRAVATFAGGYPTIVPLFAATFLFFPLLQAYIQREFEVVIFATLGLALLLLVKGRESVAAVVLAYVAWFKYIPILFLPYLAWRGWTAACAAFVAASAVILGLTHFAFGFAEFVNNNVPAHAAQVFSFLSYGFAPDAAGELAGTGFCTGWFERETTLANIRHGLCSVASRASWVAPNVLYLLLCAGVAAWYLTAHARLTNARGMSAADEAWRRGLEFSVVTTVCACFFFAHYYYLIVLVIPYAVLLTRYLAAARLAPLLLWTMSYVLVSAFVVPTGVLSRFTGVDVWAWYIRGAWFLPGELLLMGLLLFEYWALAQRRPPPAAEPA
jgi:hypothetical protein